MARLSKPPPSSFSNTSPTRDGTAHAYNPKSPQVPTQSNVKRDSGVGIGSAQIWPTNTVHVRRLDKGKNRENTSAWDLTMDFDLQDFTSSKRKKLPAVIESHLNKATQQYRSDVTEEEKTIEDQEEDIDIEADTDAEAVPKGQLHRSFSFDETRSTRESAQDFTETDDDGDSENAEPCCEIAARALSDGKGAVYFCYACKINYCESCWRAQIPHRRNMDGHRKIDIAIARIIHNTLDVKLTEQEQAKMHLLDECTSWFGAVKSKDGARFRDFGRYAALVAERNSSERKRCYPALVSFVGETGAGKSSLIKLLVSTQAPTATAPTPVVGSTANAETPTSGDVHLYADPDTFDTDRPLLYADCEGLHGGTLEPMGLKLKARRPVAPRTNRTRTASFEQHLRRRYESAEREIAWATTPEKTNRKYFVENLYPRLLYTFSDVIVFVVRNARTIEDVVQQLITWADAVITSSSNQPVLPHAIIVLNASDNDEERLWDVDASTTTLLNKMSTAVHENPVLKRYAEKWGYGITSAESLLLSYYSSVRVLRIPEKSQPSLIHQQIQKLYHEIGTLSANSHASKHRERMKLNCEELQPYLQKAFDHFCSDLDEAFDFVKASFANSGIPSDFSGNILKMAIYVGQSWRDKIDGPLLFRELSFMVASCVMLDTVRQGKLGTAAQVFPEYLDHFDEALDDFCEKFWPCEFVTPRGRCVNVKAGHHKGHQTKKGDLLGAGDYQSSFTAQSHRHVFRDEIFSRLHELLECLREGSKSTKVVEREVAATMHYKMILGPFFRHWGGAEKFISHSSCLACLVSPAEHSLPCGHVLCKRCVSDFGNVRGPTLIEMRFCPLHSQETCEMRWPISVTPANAGIRLLTIDGGGVRGIVPLTILARLEKELGLPIQNFFDLIVGTSTGGIIALGLGEKGWTVKECITKFKHFANQAFSKRRGLGWQLIDNLIAAQHNGKYKVEPLEDLLRTEYGEDSLFGGHTNNSKSSTNNSPSVCKVGVTTTTTAGRPCLLANYNRTEADSTEVPTTPRLDQEDTDTRNQSSQRSKPYDFLRAENPANEVYVWEAARATSAAPKIFEPYIHSPSGQSFLDGGIYFNNPIEVALREQRLIWPTNRPEAPDILLSLGTGYSPVRKPVVAEAPGSGIISHYRQLLKIAQHHVKSSQNSEEQYRITYDRASRDLKARLARLSLAISSDLPKLDNVNALSQLEDDIRNDLSRKWSEIRSLANRLLASSFYFEPFSGTTKKNEDESLSITGSIKCRIAAGTNEMVKLGELIRRRCQDAYNNNAAHSPCFIIEEKARGTDAEQVPLADHVVKGMIEHGQFNLGHIKITISSPVSTCIVSRLF